ncbi:hypothetical protein AVEN_54726-1 [Araneus ventricosus]|uniref:Uncharacterized protein n=1 Tax=Araneus ventricosus TaxID=182803 RepID=A0A4Y2FDC1_ARAVE|nr:hypothetical protein AVEN_54726-1 [Araneus ventricosus]
MNNSMLGTERDFILDHSRVDFTTRQSLRDTTTMLHFSVRNKTVSFVLKTSRKEAHLLKVRKEPESSTSPVTVTEEKETTHLKKVKKGVEVRASPTGVAGSAPLPVRKKQHSMYLETDLDTMETRDLASVHEKDLDDIPVYVNAEEINNPNEEIYENFSTVDYANMAAYNSQSDGSATEQCAMQDINEADERMKRFYGTSHIILLCRGIGGDCILNFLLSQIWDLQIFSDSLFISNFILEQIYC